MALATAPSPARHPIRPPVDPRPAARRRRRRTAGVAALIVAASLAYDRAGLFLVPLLFVLIVPFEKRFPRHPEQKLRRPQLGTDLGYVLAQPATTFIGALVLVPVGLVSLAWLPGLAVRPLVVMMPLWLQVVLGFLAFDLIIYWAHRWSHEIPFLWRFHAVHHSTETLDWVSGFRNHPFDGAIIAPPVVFLLAAGFPLEFTGIVAFLQIATGLFLHANVRWRLRPLHRIVITPEFHHWHHANDPEAINSNYSVFLPAWDLFFRTYFMPADRRPEVYGIDEPMAPGMVGHFLHPFRGIRSDWWRLPFRAIRHPWRAIRALGRGLRHLAEEIRRVGWRRPAAMDRSAEPVDRQPTRVDPLVEGLAEGHRGATTSRTRGGLDAGAALADAPHEPGVVGVGPEHHRPVG